MSPYRRKGKTVLHKKGGRWKKKQTCGSVTKAKKAMKLLRGIKHGMKPRKRKRR